MGCDPLTNQLANPMVQVNMEGLSSAVPQEAWQSHIATALLPEICTPQIHILLF